MYFSPSFVYFFTLFCIFQPVDVAYDAVPISQFGAAMLRGMGWKEDPKNRSVSVSLLVCVVLVQEIHLNQLLKPLQFTFQFLGSSSFLPS